MQQQRSGRHHLGEKLRKSLFETRGILSGMVQLHHKADASSTTARSR
jgi:hypothetical protein